MKGGNEMLSEVVVVVRGIVCMYWKMGGMSDFNLG